MEDSKAVAKFDDPWLSRALAARQTIKLNYLRGVELRRIISVRSKSTEWHTWKSNVSWAFPSLLSAERDAIHFYLHVYLYVYVIKIWACAARVTELVNAGAVNMVPALYRRSFIGIAFCDAL